MSEASKFQSCLMFMLEVWSHLFSSLDSKIPYSSSGHVPLQMSDGGHFFRTPKSTDSRWGKTFFLVLEEEHRSKTRAQGLSRVSATSAMKSSKCKKYCSHSYSAWQAIFFQSDLPLISLLRTVGWLEFFRSSSRIDIWCTIWYWAIFIRTILMNSK